MSGAGYKRRLIKLANAKEAAVGVAVPLYSFALKTSLKVKKSQSVETCT